MIKNFDDILSLSKTKNRKTISVAVAQDDDVLGALKLAHSEGIIDGVLVGDEVKIKKICKDLDFDISEFDVINELDPIEASRIAVEQVTNKKADMLMKGLVDSSVILKAILNKEANLRTDNLLSHVGVISSSTYERVLIVSDAAINIAPDVEGKKQIIRNSVLAAKAIGIHHPKVALVCAKEKVNPKMQATVDAKEIEDAFLSDGEMSFTVGGPFALDNAVSKKAAKQKGIEHDVAGNADILLMPNIEAGNVLYKALTFISDAEAAGIILGAKVPIIMTSRADSERTKLNSIALAMLVAEYSDNNQGGCDHV